MKQPPMQRLVPSFVPAPAWSTGSQRHHWWRSRDAFRLRESVRSRDRSTCRFCRYVGGTSKPIREIHVDHIDGDRSNNALVNLQVLFRWCHAIKHSGLSSVVERYVDLFEANGVDQVELVLETRRLRSKGISDVELVRALGLEQRAVFKRDHDYLSNLIGFVSCRPSRRTLEHVGFLTTSLPQEQWRPHLWAPPSPTLRRSPGRSSKAATSSDERASANSKKRDRRNEGARLLSAVETALASPQGGFDVEARRGANSPVLATNTRTGHRGLFLIRPSVRALREQAVRRLHHDNWCFGGERVGVLVVYSEGGFDQEALRFRPRRCRLVMITSKVDGEEVGELQVTPRTWRSAPDAFFVEVVQRALLAAHTGAGL